MQKIVNSSVLSDSNDDANHSGPKMVYHNSVDTLTSRSTTAIMPPSPAVEAYKTSGTESPNTPYSPLSAGFRSENERTILENNDFPVILNSQAAQLAQAQEHNARLWALVGKQRERIFELQHQLNSVSHKNKWYEKRPSDSNSSGSFASDIPVSATDAVPDDVSDSFLSRSKAFTAHSSASQSPTAPNAVDAHRSSSIDSSVSTLSGASSRMTDISIRNNEIKQPSKSWKTTSQKSVEDNSSELAELSMSILEMLNSKIPTDLLVADEDTRARLKNEVKLNDFNRKKALNHTLSSIVIPEGTSVDHKDELQSENVSPLEQENRHIGVSQSIGVSPAHLKCFKTKIVCGLIGKVGHELKSTKDNPVAIISLTLESTGEEVCQCLKSYNQIIELDSIIRPYLQGHSLCRLPERSIFSSQAPAKVDIRNSMLNDYFSTLFAIDDLPTNVQTTIARFFSGDHIRSSPPSVSLINSSSPEGCSQVRKHGFLTKRRRSFASGNPWKTGFFVLLGPNLHYFDRADGNLTGTIRITNARIGRQRTETNKHDEEDKQFRHAFLIVEVRQDKETRHVFCAENDKERDSWIEALLNCVEQEFANDHSLSEIPVSPIMPWTVYHDAEVAFQESTSPLNELISSPISVQRLSDVGSERSTDHDFIPVLDELINDPFNKSRSNSTVMSQNASTDALQRFRKRSFFSLRPRKSGSLPSEYYGKKERDVKNNSRVLSSADLGRMSLGFPESNRPMVNSALSAQIIGDVCSNKLFGSSLACALTLSSKNVDGRIVPSILFRTTDYLKKKKAYLEEGIFRVSGSNSQIRALSAKFDEEYDVDLEKLDGTDINVVCGLLKKWLMDLPHPVLTSGLTQQFRAAVDSKDNSFRMAKISELLRKLPKENFDMLFVLSEFMAIVLEYEDVNKMSIKNLSIIFSQTLNMPAAIFVSLVINHNELFRDNGQLVEKGG